MHRGVYPSQHYLKMAPSRGYITSDMMGRSFKSILFLFLSLLLSFLSPLLLVCADSKLPADEYPVERRRIANYTFKGTPASKIYSHISQRPMKGDVGFIKVVASYSDNGPDADQVEQLWHLPGVLP